VNNDDSGEEGNGKTPIFTDTELSKFVNTKDRDLHFSLSTILTPLFSTFRDWFRQIGKTARVWQVGFPHSTPIRQIAVS
jgi:hypothetical protein